MRSGHESLMAIKVGPNIFALIVAAQIVAFSQPSSIRIAGVGEPPELTGEPKKYTPPSPVMKAFDDAFPKDEKNIEQVKISVEKLTGLLRENPDYSDGFLMRALFNRCIVNSADTEGILNDINAAISTYATQKLPRAHASLADHYSLRAKLEFDTSHYRDALDDLETAIKEDLDHASSIFNSGDTKPDAPPQNICAWGLSDLDLLAQKFPHDYRVVLLRGLYYRSFMNFDVKHFTTAIANLRSALVLNPKSPVIYYLLGRTYAQAVFWPSLLGVPQEQSYKSAIQAYDKAVELDPALSPAYLERASAEYQLKRYQQAIKDFDKLLMLDPENSGAYNDRALAKMNLEQYHPAISDFDEFIKRKKPNWFDLSASYVYENRADCYVKLGQYQDAIADLTKAIALQLGSQGFMFTLRQFRALYPEYNGVSDDVFGRKLHSLFWPQYEYDAIDLSSKKTENDEWAIDEVLKGLYEKRGDAYFANKDFKRGALDFNRVFKGIPIFADTVDRWRLLGSSLGEKYYIDVKTLEFSKSEPERLWLKTVNENETYTVQSYEIDCSGRRVSITSTVLYSANDDVVSTSESDKWQRVVPDSRGEQLYTGMCSGDR